MKTWNLSFVLAAGCLVGGTAYANSLASTRSTLEELIRSSVKSIRDTRQSVVKAEEACTDLRGRIQSYNSSLGDRVLACTASSESVITASSAYTGSKNELIRLRAERSAKEGELTAAQKAVQRFNETVKEGKAQAEMAVLALKNERVTRQARQNSLSKKPGGLIDKKQDQLDVVLDIQGDCMVSRLVDGQPQYKFASEQCSNRALALQGQLDALQNELTAVQQRISELNTEILSKENLIKNWNSEADRVAERSRLIAVVASAKDSIENKSTGLNKRIENQILLMGYVRHSDGAVVPSTSNLAALRRARISDRNLRNSGACAAVLAIPQECALP